MMQPNGPASIPCEVCANAWQNHSPPSPRFRPRPSRTYVPEQVANNAYVWNIRVSLAGRQRISAASKVCGTVVAMERRRPDQAMAEHALLEQEYIQVAACSCKGNDHNGALMASQIRLGEQDTRAPA